MPRKPKPNITPEDVDKRTLYTPDGEKVYRLIACAVEPLVTMLELGTENGLTKPLSSFKDWIPYKLTKELPPKHRADKGEKHKKQVSPPANQVDIEKIELHVGQGDKPTTATYEKTSAAGDTIKEAILVLFSTLQIKDARKFIEVQPDSNNKKLLLGALGT